MSFADALSPEMQDTLLLGAIALAAASGAFSIFRRAALRREAQQQRRQADALDATHGDLVLGDLTQAFAAQVPVSAETDSELRKELRAAGYYRNQAVMEYAAVRTLLVVTPLIAAGMLALLAENDQLPAVLIGGGVAALLGFSLPRVLLHFQGQARVRSIENGLPVAVDLLTLCLSAGQNLLAAFRRVSKEMRHCSAALAQELDIVREHAELRSLSFALKQWAERVPSAEVRNLAMILVQAERLGTDSAAALQEHAANLRTNARQKADAKANRTMFWMLFPTILCLWIPAGIILIAPAVLEFQSQRKSTIEQWRQSRKDLEGHNPNPTAPAAPPPAAAVAARE